MSPVSKTDEQLKQDIVNQLAWDSRVDASNVNVEVNAGQATLSGNVPNYSSSIAAVEIASSVRGVVSVDDLLTVQFPTTFTIPQDEDITNNVLNLLEWNYNIDEDKIDISVDSGIVTLEGTVPSFWQRTSAQSDAERAAGVVNVVNKIAVVPTETISDELLAERILDRIESNTVANINKIQVQVEEGEVTITGKVPSWYVWSSVYDAVQYTVGVLDVKDELEIDYTL